MKDLHTILFLQQRYELSGAEDVVTGRHRHVRLVIEVLTGFVQDDVLRDVADGRCSSFRSSNNTCCIVLCAL
ncbi:MAG: hypothetical protein ABEK59_12160 [Halobacteria archaeon]